MIFKPFLVAKIMTGEKTVTRRPAPTKYREGQYVALQPGMARESMGKLYICSVRTERLGDITEDEAVLEGFADVGFGPDGESGTARENFLRYWRELYKGKLDLDMLVDRIHFETYEMRLDLCGKCHGSGMVNHPDTYEGIAFG